MAPLTRVLVGMGRVPIARESAARGTVALIFAGNGAVFASWAPRIPDVKAELDLSAGVLGLVLLAPGLAALAAMPITGALAARFGSAATTRAAVLAFLLLPAPIGLAGNAPALALALFVWGLAMGALDVAMNAQGVTVERAYGRSVLSGFHAAFSLGALAGVGIGSACAAVRIDLALQLGVLGAVLLIGLVPLFGTLLPDPRERDHRPAPRFARPTGALIALSAAAFAVLLCEGAVADWSAVLLAEDLGAGPGQAGLAFAAFSATMTAGRLVGDRLLSRFGRLPAVRLGCAVAAIGMAAGLTGATVTAPGGGAIGIAVGGFALLGAGISVTFPALLAEAGDGRRQPATAIAAVSTGGYTGFLVGPTVIGGLAELIGLPAALAVLPVMAAAAAVLVAGRRPVTQFTSMARR